MAPDTLSARWDGHRLSASSFPRQGWPRLSPSYAPPAHEGPSHHAGWRYSGSAAEESVQSHQQTSLLQQSAGTQPSSRTDRSSNPASDRPSASPTQPVLVRAYSGNAEETTANPSIMSPRRLFPFTGSRSSAPPRPSGPPLPTDKDFSIESILQAIEPDIKGTLDSIAEICGRSKLSLANEYGSHIAPLGEIRAPPGGLVPVEEASPSDERRADEGMVVFEEDPNLVDAGRDLHPFSFYRYLETFRQAATLERNVPSVSQAQPDPARPAVSTDLWDAVPDMDMPAITATRDFVSKPKNSGRDFLAGTTASGRDEVQPRDVVTPAVVSEVHLDAEPDDPHAVHRTHALPGDASASTRRSTDRWKVLDAIRSLLGWVRWTAGVAEPEARPALQSAESHLRMMLARSLNDGLALPAA